MPRPGHPPPLPVLSQLPQPSPPLGNESDSQRSGAAACPSDQLPAAAVTPGQFPPPPPRQPKPPTPQELEKFGAPKGFAVPPPGAQQPVGPLPPAVARRGEADDAAWHRQPTLPTPLQLEKRGAPPKGFTVPPPPTPTVGTPTPPTPLELEKREGAPKGFPVPPLPTPTVGAPTPLAKRGSFVDEVASDSAEQSSGASSQRDPQKRQMFKGVNKIVGIGKLGMMEMGKMGKLGVKAAVAEVGSKGSEDTTTLGEQRIGAYVWRQHRFQPNELMWAAVHQVNVALYDGRTTEEPILQPPALVLPLLSLTSITEPLSQQCCLQISSTSMPMRALTLLFGDEDAMDQWRAALREARAQRVMAAQTLQRLESDADELVTGTREASGANEERTETLVDLAKSEKTADETLQKELHSAFQAFGMDSSYLLEDSHRGVRQSFCRSEQHKAFISEDADDGRRIGRPRGTSSERMPGSVPTKAQALLGIGAVSGASGASAGGVPSKVQALLGIGAASAGAASATSGQRQQELAARPHLNRHSSQTIAAGTDVSEQEEAAAEVPSFMRAEPLPNDLVIDDEGRVRLAAAPRLIERLVYPARFDDNGKFDHRFCAALLLTYRSFYSPHELLQALLGVYHLEPPAEMAQLSAEEHSSWEAHWTWEAQRLLPVQLMICNVLQKWITNYLCD